jgi:DNA-binding NarL/FixJ family response regulator
LGIRLFAVDAHTLCRYGLARVVEDRPDIELVGEASTAAEAEARLDAFDPDVVTVAASLPDGDGLALVRTLRERRPRLGVVVMAAVDHDDPLFRAMEARASAYVARSATADEMVALIRHAAVAPESFTASGLVAALGRRRTGELLSSREREVLMLLMQGLSIAEMARVMHLSHSTAKTYTARLYDKLGAANRAQALMAALRQGLIRQDDPSFGPPFGRRDRLDMK